MVYSSETWEVQEGGVLIGSASGQGLLSALQCGEGHIWWNTASVPAQDSCPLFFFKSFIYLFKMFFIYFEKQINRETGKFTLQAPTEARTEQERS